MSEEIELKRLPLRDKSQLILTNFRVYEQKEGGFYGAKQTIIPYEAITSIQLGWERKGAALGLGIFFSVIGLVWGIGVWVGLAAPGVVNIVSGLAFVCGMLMIFSGLYKSTQIHIVASATVIGGRPQNYGDAQIFCDILLTRMQKRAAVNG